MVTHIVNIFPIFAARMEKLDCCHYTYLLSHEIKQRSSFVVHDSTSCNVGDMASLGDLVSRSALEKDHIQL